MASAAVPGIFPPVTLQALDDHGQRKDFLPSRKWVDGSVSDDLPAKRLARLYGVNHYIVSQTNPHVLPFVTDGHRKKTAMGLLAFPGEKRMNKLIAAGQRCTWPKLEMIRQQTRISRTLRGILQQYEPGPVV